MGLLEGPLIPGEGRKILIYLGRERVGLSPKIFKAPIPFSN